MRKKYLKFFIIRQAHLTIKVQKQPKFWESLQHFLAKIKYCETFYLQTISCGKAGRKKRVIFALFLSLSNLKMTSKTFFFFIKPRKSLAQRGIDHEIFYLYFLNFFAEIFDHKIKKFCEGHLGVKILGLVNGKSIHLWLMYSPAVCNHNA